MTVPSTTPEINALLESVRGRIAGLDRFGEIRVKGGFLCCEAEGSAEPATYRLGVEEGDLCVSLVMADRWLSESIEAELMHTGDRLEELLEEELEEVGFDGPSPTFQHYRSPDMLFTFRSRLPVEGPAFGGDEGAETALAYLLAYEACFRNLGDMSESEDD